MVVTVVATLPVLTAVALRSPAGPQSPRVLQALGFEACSADPNRSRSSSTPASRWPHREGPYRDNLQEACRATLVRARLGPAHLPARQPRSQRRARQKADATSTNLPLFGWARMPVDARCRSEVAGWVNDEF